MLCGLSGGVDTFQNRFRGGIDCVSLAGLPPVVAVDLIINYIYHLLPLLLLIHGSKPSHMSHFHFQFAILPWMTLIHRPTVVDACSSSM